MTKLLTLTDGTQYNIDEESSYTNVIMHVGTFAEVDMIAAKFTRENMLRVTIDTEVYEGLIPLGTSAFKDGEQIRVTISARAQTFEEITTAQISELQDAILEIISGEEEA